MPGDTPSVRRRRGRAVRIRRTTALVAALSLPLLAASSHAAGPRTQPQPADSTSSPLFAAITPASVAAALGDLRDLHDFEQAAKRPQAAAPIRHLPKVRLETVSVSGIPRVAAAAYLAAARTLARTDPACGVKWWLVAGIGFVESGHAASGGSHAPGWDGVARPPILGPVLDGSGGFAAIRDTDHGRYDADTTWDRAVGPMQFLPSTWLRWGARPDGGLGNPQDIAAAALATARYLCASGGDLSGPHGMALAVFSYNHSFDYVRLVLSVAARYAGLDPAALGVDGLPTDKQFHHRVKSGTHHRRARTSTKSGTSSGGTSPSPSPTSSGSQPSPSPSPTPTSGGSGPLPEPTPSATTILPLPTGPLLP